MRQSFPACLRLKRKADFAALRHGRRLTTGGLCWIYARNHCAHARLGLAIPRRFGTAVLRNRLKRQLREAFRSNPIRGESVDILVAISGNWQTMGDPAKEMQEGLLKIMKHLRLSP